MNIQNLIIFVSKQSSNPIIIGIFNAVIQLFQIQCSIALLFSSVQLVLSVIYPNEKIQNNKMEKNE